MVSEMAACGSEQDVLHAEGCKYEQAKRETPNKGINQRKKDGGWFSFPTEAEARRRFPRAVPCGDCM